MLLPPSLNADRRAAWRLREIWMSDVVAALLLVLAAENDALEHHLVPRSAGVDTGFEV